MKTTTCFASIVTVLISLCIFAGVSIAQPACMVPSRADSQLHPVWGGESWATYSHIVDEAHYICVGEDGGRLRTSKNGGRTWVFADTPSDFTGSIFDIWFFPNSLHGFAIGRGGRVLETTDGGFSYDYYGIQIEDFQGDPASMWGVRALSESKLIVSGLWSFQYTDDSGATWKNIDVFDQHPSNPGATRLSPGDMELFRLDVIGTPDNFVGSVGATWEASAGDRGVVLFTDSTDPGSDNGKIWWVVLDDAVNPATPSGATLVQPWSLRFERFTTDTNTAVGYVVGNRGGSFDGANSTSRIYRTNDSGRTWTFDSEADVAIYDVTLNPNGNAMFVGYSGIGGTLDPTTGIWSQFTMPSPSTFPLTPGESTGAFLAASSFGDDGLIAVGDFGQQRISFDYGETWKSMSTFYPNSDEMEQRIGDCAFVPSQPLTGCIAGQLGHIFQTVDGGCNWDLVAQFGGFGFESLDMNDDGRALAVGRDSFAYSTDFGATWNSGDWAPGTDFPPNIQFESVSLTGQTEGWAVGSSGNQPIVAYTRSKGNEWFLVRGPVADNLRLTGVDMATPFAGLFVGNRNNGTVARAYKMELAGTAITWTDVTPDGIDVGRSFEDVAVTEEPLDTARAVAVGKGALVAEWSSSKFELRATPINRDVDYFSVGLSPSGAVALAGGSYDEDLTHANSKGFVLRLTASTARQLRAFTGKDIVGISLTSDTAGFVAGQTGGDSVSFIHGNLASSILLRYLQDPPVLPVLGDANLDGIVDFLDISQFISLLTAGEFLEQADINCDGALNFLDIAPFIGLLTEV